MFIIKKRVRYRRNKLTIYTCAYIFKEKKERKQGWGNDYVVKSSHCSCGRPMIGSFEHIVLVRVYHLHKHHDQGASWGGRGFIQLTLPYHCSSPKEVRTGTKAGLEVKSSTSTN